MTSTPSFEELVNQIESLKKELEQCRKANETLQNNLCKYHRIIGSSSEGFILLNSGLEITDVNQALLTISGFERKDFIGRRIDTFYDKASVVFLSASPDHLSFEANLRASSGHIIPLLFNRSVIRDDNGQVTGFMYFLTDLTELKTTQEELKRAEQRYRSMYQNALQGMFQSRMSGRIIRANPAFARILGYDSPQEVLTIEEGANRFYFNPEDRADMIREVRKKGAVKNYELKLKRKDGKPVWILANIRLTDTDHGPPILEGMLIDNTRKKALEKELRQDRKKFRNLSIHDNLTGLYNTRHLYKALDELIMESGRAETPFSLVFMDMDNFKLIVDTFGHLNGSQALKEVAASIKGCLQKPCFGVAYGGDEFVIVLPGYRKTRAMEKVEEIRLLMKRSTYLVEAGHNVRLGASFGIATFPEDADNREGLLALADQAMFNIKQTGKGSIGI